MSSTPVKAAGMDNSRRLFIAISATDPLAESLLPVLKKLKISSDKKEMDIKWTQSSNYHITLSFLGDRPAEDLPKITQAMEDATRDLHSFDLKVSGMGGFPDNQQGRVLWLGVQCKKYLYEAKQNLEQKLSDALNLDFIEKEFSPHLTIGRLRSPTSLRDLLSPFIRKDFGKIKVSKLVLYESVQTGYYPIYKPLYEVTLR